MFIEGTLLMVGAGLVLGNFSFQFFKTPPDWGVAFERSFFQVVALLTVYIIILWRKGGV